MPAHQINLLPRDDFEKKPIGKFLNWALNIGRWIVVFTELVVILAFLSRFKLDQDLADLNESIREKQKMVLYNQETEKNFRMIQKRLLDISKLQQKQLKTADIFTEIKRITPTGITFRNLTMSEGSVSLIATSTSENSLGIFLGNLSKSPIFKSININSLVKSVDSTINFSLNFRYQKST